MKKKILIEIEYPDCDTLNIQEKDLMIIQNEVLNELSLFEDVNEGRFKITTKLIESIESTIMEE